MYGLRKSNRRVSARTQIAISGVRDGVLMLPGNCYRVVLRLSSVNFELKSEAEQDALIDTYQSFLNALPCDIQILIRIRELDMDKYLADFKAAAEHEAQPVYKTQIGNYINFVGSLISTNKILARHFYVVLPYAGEADFESVKEQLNLNADIVAKGLSRLGMQAAQLSSLELLDLFYSFYNPGASKRQPITAQTLELLRGSYL